MWYKFFIMDLSAPCVVLVLAVGQTLKPLVKACEENNQLMKQLMKQHEEQSRLINELINLPRELHKLTQQFSFLLHTVEYILIVSLSDFLQKSFQQSKVLQVQKNANEDVFIAVSITFI